MATILDRILEKKKDDLAEVATRQSAIEKAIREAPNPLGFKAALAQRIAQGQAAVIAEFKRKSPSKGIIREGASPSVIAQAYAPYATALSVLTERHFLAASMKICKKPSKPQICRFYAKILSSIHCRSWKPAPLALTLFY